MTRATLGKLTVQCHDCETIFSTDERECRACGLRTCISDENENDRLRQAIASARQRASRGGSQHALWDLIFDAEALLAERKTAIDHGEPGAAIRKLTSFLSEKS